TWRDRDPREGPKDVPPVVRLKMPLEGETIIDDAVQGAVKVSNGQLDDMILLRADGTPTYMLSVVVDDHDMGITHIIRGDDHLTNAFRQLQIFRAMGWNEPVFAHIPLIHGPDGAKLSKRHGALGVEAYRDMGYLPEALRNYLLRLGWSHGNEEIISTERAVELFDLSDVNKGASRFDFDKLGNLNGHYIRSADDGILTEETVTRLEKTLLRPLGAEERERLVLAMPGLKARAQTLVELSENAAFYVRKRPIELNEKAVKLLGNDARIHLSDLMERFKVVEPWDTDTLERVLRDLAEEKQLKLGRIAQPLRAALTGSNASPSIFEVMHILGKEESLARISDQASV
ncbi:MAG: glutamate--tRNA ligase, partial [Anaerolineales bacterium]|nr:glutamate--tRNA ligase [Anaerolineales bacterium]